jgi:hypothetical protein
LWCHEFHGSTEFFYAIPFCLIKLFNTTFHWPCHFVALHHFAVLHHF